LLHLRVNHKSFWIGYTSFAITPDGYFRMQQGDFTRPRNIKDFLLIPQEKIPPEISYFELEGFENYFC
jgi:hypothetical protein